jgi:CheY-like chemotaxis protein
MPERKALVVDDGPVERLAGKSMLEKLGYAVATAASGEEALVVLERERVSLVLCDISMPGMGGIALLEAISTRPRPPPFIMVTSHNDAGHAVVSLRKGAASYLTKPLRFDVLRDTINDAMT